MHRGFRTYDWFLFREIKGSAIRSKNQKYYSGIGNSIWNQQKTKQTID